MRDLTVGTTCTPSTYLGSETWIIWKPSNGTKYFTHRVQIKKVTRDCDGLFRNLERRHQHNKYDGTHVPSEFYLLPTRGLILLHVRVSPVDLKVTYTLRKEWVQYDEI